MFVYLPRDRLDNLVAERRTADANYRGGYAQNTHKKAKNYRVLDVIIDALHSMGGGMCGGSSISINVDL